MSFYIIDFFLSSSIHTPFFIQHGTADKNIPITQSEEFAAKLAESIGKEKVVFEKIEGAAHGGELFESDENLAKIFAFLEKYLM